MSLIIFQRTFWSALHKKRSFKYNFCWVGLGMHELSLAMSMIEIAVAHAQEDNAGKINEIEVEFGELNGVVLESLEFCFELACKDTLAEGALLSLISIPGLGRCQDCQNQFRVDSLYCLCPKCHGIRVNIIKGKELKIRSIIVD